MADAQPRKPIPPEQAVVRNGAKAADRQQREADALRENLRRRKEQARARDVSADTLLIDERATDKQAT